MPDHHEGRIAGDCDRRPDTPPSSILLPYRAVNNRNIWQKDRSVWMKKAGTCLTDNWKNSSDTTPVSTSQPRISSLRESDLEAASRLYTDTFLQDEPTSRHNTLDNARFLMYARFYLRILMKKDLSLLAWDEITGDLMGFIFCLDLQDDPQQEGPMMREFLFHYRQTAGMIDELESLSLNRESFRRGFGLHIYQVGVDRKYRRRGIAQALICRALENAKKRGFRLAIAECTSPASQKTFEKCEFMERGFLSYESFIMEGIRFFSGLEGGISLMVKDIDPLIRNQPG